MILYPIADFVAPVLPRTVSLRQTVQRLKESSTSMFDFIYRFFGTILAWFNSITGSYAIALILYALMFKIVFLPFSIKQQKNQILMAKLRPKIAKIEKKYAGRNDVATRQKMQQEIMDMQSKEGYSPLSGCLPLLLQLPIIIFLYNVIRMPLSYICKFSSDVIGNLYTAVYGTAATDSINEIALITKINEIGAANISVEGFDAALVPNFSVFGVDFAQNPTIGTAPFLLVLIPFLAAVFQWLSMFLMRKFQGNPTPTAQDSQTAMSMRIMDIIFPAMTLFIAFNMPGMLGLYWIYQSILGFIQQFILSKAMPLPKYSAEDIKEMERAAKERAKAQRTALQEKPRYKSLHYIDEDDYEQLPTLKNQAPAPAKKIGGIEGAQLKTDDKTDGAK